MTEIFRNDLPFFRGNLHTHTKNSDGRKTAEECIELYKKEGYDFLALTDHRKMSQAYEDEDILVIPSAEFDRNFSDLGGPDHAYHLTAVGMTEPIEQTNDMSPQWIVDLIKKQGALCTLCHPAWSLMTPQECLELRNYDCIEVYNGISDFYNGRGESSYHIDMLAERGVYKLITAVDDVHYYEKDVFTGWIMVQAKERTWPKLKEAILAGRFYSTQGPAIRQIRVDENGISVDTSEAVCIRCVSNMLSAAHRCTKPEEGETVCHAEYAWNQKDRFVRVEVVDKEGKKAWSNIIPRP